MPLVESRSIRLLRDAILFILLLAAPAMGRAQSPTLAPSEDRGIAGLLQQLQKLRTTARIMHTTAHPDDEDGGMMTLEARGNGATVLLMTLTRGEGGQNKFGGEITDELGILRTLELLEADRYYGVEQRFSRVADFGFSKSADETFQKWGGHETALADMVRVIRTFRPNVLIARFQGTARDGHGNHQASGIVTREAFRAAADPARFPEQIKAGLLPWQAEKLYMDNVRANEDWSVRLDTGGYDPILGTGYQQFALEGLSHQISQGVGGLRVGPGHRYTYYKLLDSTLPQKLSAGEHEKDFFDGLDTSLPALADRAGAEESKLPALRASLVRLDKLASEAAATVDPHDPSRIAAPLLEGVRILENQVSAIENSPLSAPTKLELLTQLRTKYRQFEDAANLALGATLDVVVDAGQPAAESGPYPTPQNTFQIAVPGQTFFVTAKFVNRGRQKVIVESIALHAPAGWKVQSVAAENNSSLNSGDAASARFQVTVPENAEYTKPYWQREDPQQQNIVVVEDPELTTLPFLPTPLQAVATVRLDEALNAAPNTIEAIPQTKFFDPNKGQQQHALSVGPALSVDLEPQSQVIRTGSSNTRMVTVGVTSYAQKAVTAQIKLVAPEGWKVDPAEQRASFTGAGEHNTYDFKVTPANLHEGRYAISATAVHDGRTYSEGFHSVGRDDIGSYYFYRHANASIGAVDVVIPSNLKVGYVMGSGDEIPDVLKQIGMNVELISDVASADLARYGTIILGIRAYDVRTDLRDHNRRLLDFVQGGGTLVVQYNQSQNLGAYMPYPATAGRQRVSVEEQPVAILAAADAVLHAPNQITVHDFDGWVQERGLYFLDKWDDHFTPLLASNDPGEEPLKGGMLEARFGKGTYIYTGYAFFRQLPAGVPGAIRLFVNLVSAGHEAR